MEELTAAQHLAIARDPARPNVSDYIQALFTDFLSSGATGSVGRTRPFWAAWPYFTDIR